MTSRNSVSDISNRVNVKSDSGHSSSLTQRVQSANISPLQRVEQLKRKFVSTQLGSLRTRIYSTLRQAGSSSAMALAEVDRALREIAESIQTASVAATSAAAAADAAEQTASDAQLLGKFFLSFHPGGEVRWQGRVLSQPKLGSYLVQTYSWLDGSPSEQVSVPIEQMSGWKFYGDAKTWHEDIERTTGAKPLQDSADGHTRIFVFTPSNSKRSNLA